MILQSSLVNKSSRTVIVFPILPGNKLWTFVVNVRASSINGIDKDRHLNLKQIRAVDISKFDDYQGALEIEYLDKIKNKILLIFDLQIFSSRYQLFGTSDRSKQTNYLK